MQALATAPELYTEFVKLNGAAKVALSPSLPLPLNPRSLWKAGSRSVMPLSNCSPLHITIPSLFFPHQTTHALSSSTLLTAILLLAQVVELLDHENNDITSPSLPPSALALALLWS
eukprot:1146923-Rhodomonas_salina.1